MVQGSMTASRPDYYALLGVDPDADGEAIRAAYRLLAKLHHPDLAGDGKSQSSERFLQIQEAYDVLRDPTERAYYDLERARRAALEEALALQRELGVRPYPGPLPPGMSPAIRPSPPFDFRRRWSATGIWIFVGAIVLVVWAVGLIVWQQRLKQIADQQAQATIVRVDPSPRPGPLEESRRPDGEMTALPPSLSALSKEMEELARMRASREEAARNRAKSQAEGESAEKKMAAASSSAAAAAEQPSKDGDRKVDCAGEGRRFYVLHQKDVVSVSFNGGPLMHPVINDLGTGMIMMSRVEPSNKISIAFMKGDKDRTIVIISDAVGNVFRTFGVECSAALF